MPTRLATLRDLLPSVRLRTVALGAVFAFSTFAVQAAPSGLPVDRPAELQPQPVQALGCASEPTFTGYITNTYTTTAATLSTTGLVRGYISDVLTTWSCTAAYRYDGLAWQRETPTGGANYQWGTLINSTSVPCNWVVNETSYLKANGGSSCHTSDSDNGMQLVLAATGADPLMERIWRADNSPDEPGDFMFVHSDCTSYYQDAETPGQIMRWATTFGTAESNRPGANCDPSVIDGTGTTQSIVVDGTPPVTAFDWPATGTGPVVVPSAFASVRFDATDNVAGFATGANDWDLQRQKAAWNGSTCGTFGNDGSATSGVTDALDQVVTQSLDANACYQWTLAASDKNGNAAATITSGSIRVDPGATLGLPSFGSVESWDLGAGDSLAVNVGTGNAVLSHPIVSLPIQGSSVGLSLTYNRQDTTNVGMGTGWRLDAFRRLSIATNGDVTFTDGQGARHVFVWNVLTSTYTRPSTLYATLTKDTGPNPDEYTLTYRDLSKDVFSELVTGTAYLKREQDRHNNGVNFGYTSTNLTSITDTVASRSIALAWTSGTLTSITDWATIDGAGIVQASGTPNRTHRFFYSGGQLIGWADPLNTGSSCTSGVPSGASHVTCIAYPTNGLEISKTQTVTVLSGSSLSTLTRTGSTGDTALKTVVAFAGSDVTSVKDAQEAKDGTSGTLFSHPGAWQTRVIRDGAGSATTSLDTTTTSTHLPPTLGAGPDSLARIGTERRALASDPNGAIDRVTTYSTTYPIEPASIVEDAGSGRLNRTTTYEYVASSLGLLLRIKEPLAGTSQRWTEYVYNPNNDVSLVTVSLDGGSTKTVTRTCYTTQSNTCLTSETGLSPVRVIENWVSGGAVDDDTNVATDYTYDAQGRMTFETRHVRSSSGGVVDDRVTGYVHASNGTLTTMIANYSDGDTADTSDSTPSSPDWARTDLTTAYTYDSAGNQASVADARRPLTTSPGTDDYITRTTYDALGQAITTRQPTTKDGATCSPDPACRTATTTYDELGGARLAIDSDGTQTGTETDRAGRTVKAHEDPDGAGGTAARQTSLMTLDPQGRTLTSKDDRQLDGSFGQTTLAYDELGRSISVIEADVPGSTGPDEATTITTYDALDRVTCVQDGWSSGACATATSAGLSTITTYDLGGRVTAIDDEFTCTTTTSDYRDRATEVIEGRSAGTCTGAGTRTITQTYDGLGRLATRTTGGLTLENNTYDSAGRLVKSWADEGAADRVTETWYTKLDQALETRRHLDTSGTLTERTWSRSTADAAGNETDRCTWTASPTEWCHKADDATWASPVPITRSSSIYDARNQRIGLFVPGEGETTYDPTADYQVQGVFLPLGTGTRERQTIHGYDSRDRLVTITVYECTAKERPFCTGAEIASTSVTDTYEYDDAGNRTKVVEDNGSGALTRYYCYDARNQLMSVSTSSATCASGVVETYAYDDGGNRTTAPSRTFTYTAAGQLATCNPTCGTPTFDADGRLTAITTASGAWTYQYDAEGRLTTACKASSCTGTPARLDMTYDAQGHRIRLVETPAAGASPVVTTDFAYEGERVVREVSTSSAGPIVTRTFTTDEAGAILKMTVVTTGGGSTADDGTYLVTYNGHGDAISLAEIETINGTGVLTTANRVTYSTWGTPDVTTHNGYASLGFRYLYVGRFDVQWDDFSSAGLLYMHARHYHPEFGRFLQPDPSAAETNLYAYAENSPITKIDPSGRWACLLALAGGPAGAVVACGLQVGAVAFAAYAAGFAANKLVNYWCRAGCGVNLSNSSAAQAAQNYAQGMDAEKRALRDVRIPFRVYLFHVRFVTWQGVERYLDICEWYSLKHLAAAPFKPVRCWEVKSGGAKYYLTGQWYTDLDISRQFGFPIYLIHYK